jgi:hypothetical protein
MAKVGGARFLKWIGDKSLERVLQNAKSSSAGKKGKMNR